jgi:hypothetical protein
MKDVALIHKKAMSFGNKALGKQENIPDVGQGILLLKGSGIGTVVVDNDVAMIDEEHTCCRKIARFNVREVVVEELVRVRRPIKGGNMEDKRDTVGWGMEVEGNCCRRSFIFQSIHHRKPVL